MLYTPYPYIFYSKCKSGAISLVINNYENNIWNSDITRQALHLSS